MDADLVRSRLRWLERAGVALLLLAALIVRARDLDAPFDRSFAGYQGAFFATTAVGYERFGIGRFAGYPALALDGPCLGGLDDVVIVEKEGVEAAVYRNHPPLVPLVAWASIAAFGPAGWEEAWREHRAPQGIEATQRLPFLVLHLVGLLALWWAMRIGFGAPAAMIALALYAVVPVALVFGPRANYETPSLPFVLLAIGFHSRWLRDSRARDLAGAGAAIAVGCAFTWAPALFVPVLSVHAAARRGLRSGGLTLAGLGLAATASLGFHVLLSRSSGAPAQGFLARARLLLEPLLDGSQPITSWLVVQRDHALDAFGAPLLSVTLLGFGILHVGRRVPALGEFLGRQRSPAALATPIDVATPLLAGSALYLVCFYRHTLEDQPTFLLYAAPAAAAFAALAIDAFAGALLRLRAGIAPVVVAASLVAIPCLVRADAWKRELATDVHGAPAPFDLAAEVQPLVPVAGWTAAPRALGFDLPTAYYAWRNLVPVERFDELRANRERSPILGRLPAFVLLRRTVAASVDREIAADGREIAADDREIAEAGREIAALAAETRRHGSVEAEHRSWVLLRVR